MQVDIHQVVPDQYNPTTQIHQWGDIMPAFQLPSDKIFRLTKGKEWNHQQVLSRGLTHLAHNDFHGIDAGTIQQLKDQGKTFHDVPITPELFGIGASGPNEWVGDYPNNYNRLFFPNGLPDYNQGFAYGQGCDISHRIIVGETMENTHYTNPAGQHWAGYYDAKAPRLDARFGAGNWRMAHDYMFVKIGPDWYYITEQQAKNYFRNPNTAPGSENLNNSLKHCNMYGHGVYLGGMDRDKRAVYALALQARFYKAVNRHCIAYFAHDREWMPNMKHGQIRPEGILYMEQKIPVGDSVTAGIVVAGLHFGDGFSGWGGSGKVTNKIWSTHWFRELFNGSFWVKNGESQTRSWESWPYLSGDMSYTTVSWQSNNDMASFAAYAYAATLGQVYGGTRKAAKYKVGNGAFYNPVNTFEDDLCHAAANKKPICETVMKNGKEAIFFIDPCSDNKRKTVTVIGQSGATYTFEACGDMPHLSIANL
ncbi:hypothetical protein [Dyadobacter aurulentus]|uniref:hypothetical protein n=1 Tax=Dyadobacter sp. UC 10 TaxID=2605428 RepID=UPI0011F1E32B|nr:hypothetical protein [Dyadobacter sp. UC 10]KAA0992783.1 hypothetical protein FXO21_22690 [Dyadobacter sp. UC 10]